MFDEKEYKAVFSKVTASGEIHRRILNMANEKKKNRTFAYASKGLAAALMASLMAVTAAATGMGWFTTYFSEKTEEPLSTEQINYIEKNEQNFELRETQDGYTMELKSAITDGDKAYICIGITAPEDPLLNATDIAGYSPEKPTLLAKNWNTDFLTNQKGEPFFGSSRIASVEDYDGLDNTQNLVIELTADSAVLGEKAFGADQEWNLNFDNLIAKYNNLAYMQELTEGKYKGQTDFFFTPEESAQLYPEVVLAEGVWKFTFRFSQPDIREIELVRDPVAAKTAVGMNTQGEYVYDTVNITSFILRSLSASVYTDNVTYAPDFTAAKEIYVVMKDGSKILLDSESGGSGEQQLRAEAPILLENVDYVLLADGLKLTVSIQ